MEISICKYHRIKIKIQGTIIQQKKIWEGYYFNKLPKPQRNKKKKPRTNV